MRYHNITKDDMLNGDGLRVVLWVAGCGHHCKGCQNPITWDPNGGIPFDDAAKQRSLNSWIKIIFPVSPFPEETRCIIQTGKALLRWQRKSKKNIQKRISGFIPDMSGNPSVTWK